MVTSRTSKARSGTAKEISAFAWIRDAEGRVLLVRQSAGKKLWALPGGKVDSSESLRHALAREVREEIGRTIKESELVDLFDRPLRRGIAVLFLTTLRQGTIKFADKEICEAEFFDKLPRLATASLRYFWKRHLPGASAKLKS